MVPRRTPGQAALWVALWGLLACGPALDAALLRNPQGSPPAQLHGVIFEGYSGGEREVEVRATSADLDVDGRVVRLQQVRIAFEDPQYGPIQIQAKRASFSLDTDDFVLRDQVKGSTAAGESFTTAEVRYDQAAGRLWTDQPVRLERDGLQVDGVGLEIDLATRRLRLLGGIRTRMAGR